MNKKFRGTRKAYAPKGKTGVSTAVKKYVKKVTARTRPEMKSIQTNSVENGLITQPINTALAWQELVQPTQGTARNNRIGNEIYLHGFHAKGSFINTSAVPVYVRRLVVGYTTGVTTGVNAELFDNGIGAGVTITTTGVTMALITNKINKAQFKVYFDKVIKLSPSTATDGSQTKLYNHFQKFGGKKIRFEGSGVGLNNQDFILAEVYIVAQADNDAAGTNIVEWSENNSIYFTDP